VPARRGAAGGRHVARCRRFWTVVSRRMCAKASFRHVSFAGAGITPHKRACARQSKRLCPDARLRGKSPPSGGFGLPQFAVDNQLSLENKPLDPIVL
jgi:hypothetical protein